MPAAPAKISLYLSAPRLDSAIALTGSRFAGTGSNMMRRSKTRRIAISYCWPKAVRLLIGLGALLVASGVLAQTATLEEVVVTAQKREQPQQDVPIAVSVLGADAVVGRSLSDLGDLGTQVAGVMTQPSYQGGANIAFTIRGIGQTDFIATDDPGVGVYVDGVFIARTSGGLLDLTDIDRVEVLKGPQGTLFGKNTVGGAISVYTKMPDFTPDANVFLRAGERDRLDAGFMVNLPLIDNTFALRINVVTKNQDGFGRSLETGQLYGGEGKNIAHVAALWL